MKQASAEQSPARALSPNLEWNGMEWNTWLGLTATLLSGRHLQI